MRLSLYSYLSAIPSRRELQLSNLELMRETASLLNSISGQEGADFFSQFLRNWQNKMRHKCLICASMEDVSSQSKPRFLTDWENGISQPEMDTGARLRMTWLNLDLSPTAISSVLSSFIFKWLSPIHSATSSIQSFKQQKRTGKAKGTLISSTKKWYEIPDRDWCLLLCYWTTTFRMAGVTGNCYDFMNEWLG